MLNLNFQNGQAPALNARNMNAIVESINTLGYAVGGPNVASTVSEMTDTSKVYVYTGSETGYTAGNWYYYNGTAWVSGGVYQAAAVETDTTLTMPGVAADAKATGDAVSDLKSALSTVVMDVLNIQMFSADSSAYVTTDGYLTTITATDTRAEALLNYHMRLEAGKTYAVVFDDCSYPATRFLIYNVAASAIALNENINGRRELTFTPTVTGAYCLKIIGNNYPNTIKNLRIVDYRLWKDFNTVCVLPDFNTNYTDDENITHAIYMAYIHGFPVVEIPYKSGGYTVETPIKMYSNVELRASKNVLFTLADQANCQMVVNANMTKSSITDKNITVNGGTWDGNHDNQVKITTDDQGNRITPVVGMQFAGVDGLTVKNCRIQNARLYGILIGNAQDVVVDNVDIEVGDVNNPDNSDGLHFLGPINHASVVNCRLRSEDNCLAFNTDDVNHGIYTTTGDINNIYVNNLYINNYDGGQGILLLSSTHFIYNATLSNISGVGGYLLNLSNFGLAANQNGIWNEVHVENVVFEMYGNWKDAIILAGQFRNLTFEDINFTLNYRTVSGIDIIYIRPFSAAPTYSTVRDMSVRNVFANVRESNRSLYIVDIGPSSTVQEMTISGIKSKNNAGTLYPINIADTANVGNIKLLDCVFNNAFYGFMYLRGAASHVDNIETSGLTMIDRASPYKILNPNNGVIRKFVCRDGGGCGYGVEQPETEFLNVIANSLVSSPTLPNIPIYYNAGQLIVDSTGVTNGWVCTKSGVRYTSTRQPNTDYEVGALVMYGIYLLICHQAGTTGSGEITPIETNGFIDGTCTWWVLYKGIAEFVEN